MSRPVADALLILIDLRGVDEPIAHLQGLQDGLRDLRVAEFVGAEAHHGHEHAVLQGHGALEVKSLFAGLHLHQGARRLPRAIRMAWRSLLWPIS